MLMNLGPTAKGITRLCLGPAAIVKRCGFAIITNKLTEDVQTADIVGLTGKNPSLHLDLNGDSGRKIKIPKGIYCAGRGI